MAVIDVSRVHYFDANGKRIRIVGRKGQGPEEFQYLTSICRTRGDTLILNDSHNRRLSVLDGSGRVVRTILQGDNGSAPFSFCLDDGTFVLERSMGEAGARQSRITRLRTDGSIVNPVGAFARTFDMVTMVTETIAASGDALYRGDPFTSEIHVYDPSGRLRRIIRTADQGARITDAEAEERMGMTIPSNVTAAERTARMERLRALPRGSPTWPVFMKVEVGADGTIWVQDYQKTFPSPDALTAIDSTGRIVGRLVFPAVPVGTRRPDVHSFGRDYLMLRRFDADGATSLAIYPLVRIQDRSR